MNILIVGNGGREHAFAWKIRQSPRCSRLYVAPGNAGTSLVAENVTIGVNDFEKLSKLCLQNHIDLIVVGPEGPLVDGIRDYFESDSNLSHILMVGPGRSGARLEGSKDFSKQFMIRHGVPTARARTFMAHELVEATTYLNSCKPPIVLKADGLAAGKGVIITPSIIEAKQSITEMLGGKFGSASAKVLVEEFLDGVELSVFVLTDGRDYVILPEAKDYKRIGEGDKGLNTGGMGAVSPVVFADKAFMDKVEKSIIRPTIKGLAEESIPYKGFIFFGLINVNDEPYVIEYNARMGDPETEVVMPRIKSDLVEALVATAQGKLSDVQMEQARICTTTVMMVSEGYPGDYELGKPIAGLQQENALIFHAGTKSLGGTVVTNGGRVLAVTGKGSDAQSAADDAYRAVRGISWPGAYFRRDIGLDLLNWKR